MTREEAIKEINKVFEPAFANYIITALTDSITVSDKVLDQTRWIPVNERLPEKNVEVLVTTKYDEIAIAELYGGNDWFIHKDIVNFDADAIVAWMPLPEPYKAEGMKVYKCYMCGTFFFFHDFQGASRFFGINASSNCLNLLCPNCNAEVQASKSKGELRMVNAKMKAGLGVMETESEDEE